MPMTITEACGAIVAARAAAGGDAIVVATMSSMFAFDQLQMHQGRMGSVPLMGGAAGLGLGLALARPDRQILVVDGDASLLMALGGLVTVSTQAPARYLHILANNGTQFTGGSNLKVPGNQKVDFPGMALAAGYKHARRIDSLADWIARLPSLMTTVGPGFVELTITPAPARFGAAMPQSEVPDRQFNRMGQEAEALSAWLSASTA